MLIIPSALDRGPTLRDGATHIPSGSSSLVEPFWKLPPRHTHGDFSMVSKSNQVAKQN